MLLYCFALYEENLTNPGFSLENNRLKIYSGKTNEAGNQLLLTRNAVVFSAGGINTRMGR